MFFKLFHRVVHWVWCGVVRVGVFGWDFLVKLLVCVIGGWIDGMDYVIGTVLAFSGECI